MSKTLFKRLNYVHFQIFVGRTLKHGESVKLAKPEYSLFHVKQCKITIKLINIIPVMNFFFVYLHSKSDGYLFGCTCPIILLIMFFDLLLH